MRSKNWKGVIFLTTNILFFYAKNAPKCLFPLIDPICQVKAPLQAKGWGDLDFRGTGDTRTLLIGAGGECHAHQGHVQRGKISLSIGAGTLHYRFIDGDESLWVFTSSEISEKNGFIFFYPRDFSNNPFIHVTSQWIFRLF